MPNKSYVVMVFRSRQHALNFADLLSDSGVRTSVIPTPKELSLGCGFSVKVENGYLNEMLDVGKRNSIAHNGVYRIIIKDNVMSAVKIA